MSAIDTMENVHVGNFFDIPIYWVLEESNLNNLTDHPSNKEKINPFFLSVGGGSGEHSALILNNEAILVRFLNHLTDTAKPGEFNDVDYQIYELAEKVQDFYMKQASNLYGWSLDQNQWSLEEFIHINTEISKKYKSKDSLQDKIQNAFALFIIYEMPLKHCLKDPQLIEIASLIRTNKWKSVFEESNILEKYIGFEAVSENAKSGKVTRNNKTVWGYSLEDWKKETNSVELAKKLTTDLPVKMNTSKIKI